LQRLIDTHRLGEAARLLSDTWLAWALRGSAGEGLEWVSRIRADSRSAALTPADRAHLELVTGGLRYATGDLAGTAAAAAEAVALARTADPAILPDAFLLLGSGQLFTGAGEAAVQTLGEAASLAAAADDAWSATHARIADGQRLLTLGRGGPAATVLAEAEAMARDLASPFTLSVALNVQATQLLGSGDDDGALDKYREATRLSARSGRCGRWCTPCLAWRRSPPDEVRPTSPRCCSGLGRRPVTRRRWSSPSHPGRIRTGRPRSGPRRAGRRRIPRGRRARDRRPAGAGTHARRPGHAARRTVLT